jgi:hypothetical protein
MVGGKKLTLKEYLKTCENDMKFTFHCLLSETVLEHSHDPLLARHHLLLS